MKKYIITILSTIISIALFQGLFLGSASAALATNDCSKAANYSINGIGWDKQYDNIYPYENFVIASKNLLAYCCKEKFRKNDIDIETNCTDDLPINFPESDFYYDHLIDVGFRSLDVVGIYDGQIVDQSAKIRNDFITQKDNPTKAVIPIEIQNKYNENWIIKSILDPNMISDYNSKLEAGGSVTLAEKYINLCLFIKTVYQTEGLISDSGKGNRSTNAEKYYNDCKLIARYRINQEYKLAKLLMAQASIRTLTDSIKSYAIDEFVQNRLMKLFDKLSDISELFSTISSQASLTEKCSN